MATICYNYSMQVFNPDELKRLYRPPNNSHKGQNGKLLIIGGSSLFHAASLWALEIASKIVDMVYYSSVPENNQIILEAKKTFRNGIVVRRENLQEYVEEADCILIGPGMARQTQKSSASWRIKGQNQNSKLKNLYELKHIKDEGLQTYLFTQYLLSHYPNKKWVIDAGALQEMEVSWVPDNAILTPHAGEFEKLFLTQNHSLKFKTVLEKAKKYNCTILLKGDSDIVCSPSKCCLVKGGNAGMTKGGTGDVLAGLTAAFYCKNEPFLSACAASYLNKKAGESLFEKQGFYFNASDLINELPKVMKKYLRY